MQFTMHTDTPIVIKKWYMLSSERMYMREIASVRNGKWYNLKKCAIHVCMYILYATTCDFVYIM